MPRLPKLLDSVSDLAHVHILVHVAKATQPVLAQGSPFTAHAVAGAISPVCFAFLRPMTSI